MAPGGDVPGRIERRAGGVALNVAVGLGRAGHPVALVAAVGQDDAGAALVAQAKAEGVDCGAVVTARGKPTDTYIAIEDQGGGLVAALADTGLPEREADAIVARALSALPGTGQVLIDANLPVAAIERLALAAGTLGIEVVLNPVSPARAPRLRALLGAPGRAVIIGNLAEARVLTGQNPETAEAAAAVLISCGARAALVTEGARPAALACAGGLFTAVPPRVPHGASVTGAGDALIAGFLGVPDRDRDPQAALEAALSAAARHLTTRIRAWTCR